MKKINDGLDLVSFLNGLVFYAPIALLVRTNAGVTMAQFFVLQAVLSLTVFLFEIPTGVITDRVGYKNTMILAQVTMFLSKVLLLAAYIRGSFALFVIEAIVEGFAACFLSETQEAFWRFFVDRQYGWKSYGNYVFICVGVHCPDRGFGLLCRRRDPADCPGFTLLEVELMLYFIADTHFSEENIMRYENRPFECIAEMDSTLIQRWNSRVCEGDEVYVLGDFGADGQEAAILGQLNGMKYLVKGNHDVRTNQYYRDAGFHEVYDCPVIIRDFWILSHEPLYVNTNMPYANLFGHVHSSPVFKTYSRQHYCVSVERVDYRPISFDEIVRTIQNEGNENLK